MSQMRDATQNTNQDTSAKQANRIADIVRNAPIEHPEASQRRVVIENLGACLYQHNSLLFGAATGGELELKSRYFDRGDGKSLEEAYQLSLDWQISNCFKIDSRQPIYPQIIATLTTWREWLANAIEYLSELDQAETVPTVPTLACVVKKSTGEIIEHATDHMGAWDDIDHAVDPDDFKLIPVAILVDPISAALWMDRLELAAQTLKCSGMSPWRIQPEYKVVRNDYGHIFETPFRRSAEMYFACNPPGTHAIVQRDVGQIAAKGRDEFPDMPFTAGGNWSGPGDDFQIEPDRLTELMCFEQPEDIPATPEVEAMEPAGI